MNRYRTQIVEIGDVPLGGTYPIRIQSMTTTDTMDTKSTVEQTIRIINAGADYVRITVPSIQEAKNLANIKKDLRKKGYKTPLIADIHFTPNAAEEAGRIVEKVRINPGNYTDKKRFIVKEYSDSEYNEELDKIRKKLIPLLRICKSYGTALRIGVNHGSLSDRIVNRYGDTPMGMVESALEFVRICEDENFCSIVLSMKASNPQVMIQAYRLLVKKMNEEYMNYPLHLGVTEAGSGEDGRIKSAIGIGTLLEEGLGDTIRVSLTEEPEYEIPVCNILKDRYKEIFETKNISLKQHYSIPVRSYEKRKTYGILSTGGNNVPVVIISAGESIYNSITELEKIKYHYSNTLNKWNTGVDAPDFIYLGNRDLNYKLPERFKKIFDYSFWENYSGKDSSYTLLNTEQFNKIAKNIHKINFDKFILIESPDIDSQTLENLKKDKRCILILSFKFNLPVSCFRNFFKLLEKNGIMSPVILKNRYHEIDNNRFSIYSAIDFGGLITDGYGNGIWIEGDFPIEDINNICFSILQATRTRISRTEYISCPSCGRTLFNLQKTTQLIQEKTNHLKGLKIAIMGCIVNGPGEMADADYGYVGSGPGKVTLYKGKEIVKRNINADVALDELIEIIKKNNDWVEKQE